MAFSAVLGLTALIIFEAVQINAAGDCEYNEGKRTLGSTWIDGHTVFSCYNDDGKATVGIIGCVTPNKDTVHIGRVHKSIQQQMDYLCTYVVDAAAKAVLLEVRNSECYDGNVPRKIGETWNDDVAQLSYRCDIRDLQAVSLLTGCYVQAITIKPKQAVKLDNWYYCQIAEDESLQVLTLSDEEYNQLKNM